MSTNDYLEFYTWSTQYWEWEREANIEYKRKFSQVLGYGTYDELYKRQKNKEYKWNRSPYSAKSKDIKEKISRISGYEIGEICQRLPNKCLLKVAEGIVEYIKVPGIMDELNEIKKQNTIIKQHKYKPDPNLFFDTSWNEETSLWWKNNVKAPCNEIHRVIQKYVIDDEPAVINDKKNMLLEIEAILKKYKVYEMYISDIIKGIERSIDYWMGDGALQGPSRYTYMSSIYRKIEEVSERLYKETNDESAFIIKEERIEPKKGEILDIYIRNNPKLKGFIFNYSREFFYKFK